MNLKRVFAWACLALVLVAEVALFRAYRDLEALRVELRLAQTQMRQMQDELDELRHSNAGLQAAEISRLRKVNAIFTNKLAALQQSILPLISENLSNAQHLATARTALRLQQDHLQELQDENAEILDTSLTVIAQKTCLNHLRLIDDAKQEWAADYQMPRSAVPSVKNLLPYFRDGIFPECPGGGAYSLNAVDEVPTCSIPGHALPQ
jgi:chromosome segregation ATPase